MLLHTERLLCGELLWRLQLILKGRVQLWLHCFLHPPPRRFCLWIMARRKHHSSLLLCRGILFPLWRRFLYSASLWRWLLLWLHNLCVWSWQFSFHPEDLMLWRFRVHEWLRLFFYSVWSFYRRVRLLQLKWIPGNSRRVVRLLLFLQIIFLLWSRFLVHFLQHRSPMIILLHPPRL